MEGRSLWRYPTIKQVLIELSLYQHQSSSHLYVEWVANHVYGCKSGQIQLAHVLHCHAKKMYKEKFATPNNIVESSWTRGSKTSCWAIFSAMVGTSQCKDRMWMSSYQEATIWSITVCPDAFFDRLSPNWTWITKKLWFKREFSHRDQTSQVDCWEAVKPAWPNG